MTDSRQRLGWLQVLRGVAAAGVVVSHGVEYLAPDAPGRWLVGALNHLGSGVDLFFVISGFIMVHTTMGIGGGWRAALGFAAKRMQRVWPAYLVLTLVVGFGRFGWGLIGDAAPRLMLLKSLLFVPASYDTLFADQIIGPGWTLGFEVYFYAVFALALLFGRWRWLFLAAWCAVLLVIVPLAFGAPLTGIYEAWATDYPLGYLKLATSPFVWEFVVGGLAAALHRSRLRIGSAWLARGLAFAAAVFAAWNTFDPLLPGTFGLAAGYALLIAVLSVASKTTALPAVRPLRYLGDISYTLYIEHMAVIHSLLWLYAATGLNHLAASWANVVLSLAISIAAAALTSRFLERDMLQLFWSVCRLAWAEPPRRADETGAEAKVSLPHAEISPVVPGRATG